MLASIFNSLTVKVTIVGTLAALIVIATLSILGLRESSLNWALVLFTGPTSALLVNLVLWTPNPFRRR
jgi:hypothetical protein